MLSSNMLFDHVLYAHLVVLLYPFSMLVATYYIQVHVCYVTSEIPWVKRIDHFLMGVFGVYTHARLIRCSHWWFITNETEKMKVDDTFVDLSSIQFLVNFI